MYGKKVTVNISDEKGQSVRFLFEVEEKDGQELINQQAIFSEDEETKEIRGLIGFIAERVNSLLDD